MMITVVMDCEEIITLSSTDAISTTKLWSFSKAPSSVIPKVTGRSSKFTLPLGKKTARFGDVKSSPARKEKEKSGQCYMYNLPAR